MVYSCLSNLHDFALKSSWFCLCNLMFSWWIPSSYWLNSCFCWLNQLNPHSCWGSPGIFRRFTASPWKFSWAPLARGRRAAAPRKRCQSVVATLVTFTINQDGYQQLSIIPLLYHCYTIVIPSMGGIMMISYQQWYHTGYLDRRMMGISYQQWEV